MTLDPAITAALILLAGGAIGYCFKRIVDWKDKLEQKVDDCDGIHGEVRTLAAYIRGFRAEAWRAPLAYDEDDRRERGRLHGE